jgi:hypothetical protein
MIKKEEMVKTKNLQGVVWLIIFFLFAFASYTYAGMAYQCVDKKGNNSFSDYPLDGQTCKEMGEIKEITAEEKLDYEMEKEEKARKELRKNAKKSPLKTCFETANDFYEEQLKSYCKENGLRGECKSMPFKVAKPVQRKYIQQVNQCIQSSYSIK